MLVVYLLIGLVGGLIGGTFGVGGGAIMVPMFVLLLGFSQHDAQGTSLAIMLPPVTLLAVLRYYYNGHVKITVAALAALGFIFGALIGAHFIQNLPDANLKRAFGIFLMIVGLKMAFFR